MRSGSIPKRALLGGGALLLAALALFAFWALGREEPQTAETYAMGTYIRQTVYGANGEEALRSGSAAVNGLERLISWRVEGSDIHRLNQNGPEGAEIDPQTWEILQACQSVSRNSAGAFDVTVGPVSRLWDFDGSPRVPSQDELDAALKLVGYHGLSLPMEYEAVLAAGCSLDLGAVGKGAACDAVQKSWKENGISRGVVSVGGSVGLYGKKPWGEPWAVAVRDPAGTGSLGTLSLPGGCVSTSGSYEKTFTQNGTAYHHILDPRTGFPADSGLVSVTVWRDQGDGLDGALTDALATACFVLGAEKSPPLLERFQAEAVWVSEDRTVSVTEGLKGRFSLTGEAYALEELP